MTRSFGSILTGVLLYCSFLLGNAYADIPGTLNYQGYLTDGAGTPVNSSKSIVFNLYTSSSGGVPLWSETQASVTISNGIYQVILGSVTPLNLPFNQTYYVGVAIGGDPELTPRQPLTSAPYALGLAPGSTVTLSDPASNASALSVTSNSTNANAFSVIKTGLFGHGGAFTIDEPTNNYSAVYGYSQGTGAGIYGAATTGASAGQFDIGGAANSKPAILAQTLGTGNAGRFIINNSGSTNHSIYTSTNGSGYGVWANSASGIGVYGSSTSNNGVFGITTTGLTGVTGRADNISGYGVYGVNWATGAYGYLGREYGVFGNGLTSIGVKGLSSSSTGVYGSSETSSGVHGVNTAGTSGVAGVYGRANNPTGTTYGVMGSCAGNTSYAVYGTHGTTNNYGYLGTNTYGAYGYNNSSHNYGGLGGPSAGVTGSGSNGVYAVNSSNTAINAYLATASYAGDFSSDIRVKGEVKREYVAGAPKNAVPIAYGTVNSNGTIASGSGNYTVSYNSTSTWYEITITDETYHYLTHSTLVTPVGATAARFATTSSVSGRLIVAIFDTSANKQTNLFNFVVYRP